MEQTKFDEFGIDQSLVQEREDAFQQQELEAQQAAEQAVVMEQQRKQQEEEERKKAEGVNDLGDVAKEIGGAVAGGAVQAVSEVVTAPERIYDLFTGQIGEDYEPDWDPLKGAEDHFKPRTWWGSAIKEATSFLSVFVPVAGQVGKVGKLSKMAGLTGTIARGAVAGAATDILKEDTYTKDGLTGQAFKAAGINFGDNAGVRTLINVTENMGIGIVADAAIGKVFGKAGLDDVSQRIAKRNADVAEQTLERGKQQLKDPGFGGFKNKPIADQAQGNTMSRAKPSEILDQKKQIDTDVRQADGSTDAFMTPAQISRSAYSAKMSDEVFTEAVGEVVSDSKLRQMLEEIKKENPSRSANDLMADVLQRLGTDVDGRVREFSVEDAQEFIKYLRSAPKNVIDGREVLRSEDILASDVVLGSLQKTIRDMGIAAREVGDDVDVFDKDGIMDQAFDAMKVLLYETKRARRSLSLGLRDLRKDSTLLPVDEDLVKAEVNEGIDFLRQLIKDDPTGDLGKAITEFNSMGGKISNYEDLDAFARKTFNGFNDGKRKTTGLLIRELNSMMVNSVLSSPKTPVRALIGTVANTLNREYSLLTGALVRAGVGDMATGRVALSELAGMVKAVPEAFSLFKKKLKGYWSNDMATLKTRYVNYEKSDLQWKAYGDWVEARGSESEKAAYRFGNMVRGINDSNLFTYSSKLMAATDDAFKVIIARGRARSQAMSEALSNSGGKMSKEALAESQEKFYKQLLDDNGNINLESDLYMKGMYEEATLTADLEGFNKFIENAFNAAPPLKPFFLFARTGVNGLAMTAKNTPLLGALMTKQRAILLGSADNLEPLAKYGISTAQELATEKALIMGRQAIGVGSIFMMSQLYQSNRLHGNGPQNRSLRQAWIDGGWRPREIKIGDAWVSTSLFEPYSTILDAVADIHDNQEALGDRDTENGLLQIANIAAQAAFDKSYLQGLSQLFDAMNGEGNFAGILGSTANNLIPASSLRNDIGKLFMPYMLEHNRGIADTIRDRNRLTEFTTDDPLSIKYDILTPEPVRNWHWSTRVFNMMSPVQISLDYSPGRQLLFDSNFDLRTSVNYSPRFEGLEAINLTEEPVVRSMFQKAMGEQNGLKQLEALAKDPKVKASLAKMKQIQEIGRAGDLDSIDGLYHNQQIKIIMNDIRKKAWAKISQEPEVQELMQKTRERQIFNVQTDRQTSNPTQDILNMYK